MAMKRKSLHDFFDVRVKKRAVRETVAATRTALISPPGASIIHNFMTCDEESRLLHFLDVQSWRTDLTRRTMHYGGTYCLMPPKGCTPEQRKEIEQTILKAPPLPPEMDFVVHRMVEQGLYNPSLTPGYCIVNEYRPGQGISAHVENFRFGEPVCSLTLAGADTMRFHELSQAHDGSVRSGKASTAPRTGVRKDVVLPQRSLLVLRGDARSTWQHEIVRGKGSSKTKDWRRVSLTFRVDKKT